MKRSSLFLLIILFLPSLSYSVMLEGTWENTSFGSNGPAFLELSITPPTISITADLDGGVFGFGNPDPVTLTGTIAADGSASFGVLGDSFYGDISGTLDTMDNIEVSITNLPTEGPTPTGNNIFSTSLTGSLVRDAMLNIVAANFNYLVIFNCGTGSMPMACNGPDQGGIERNDYALGIVNTEAVIPIPPAVFLFAAPLVGLLGFSRRRSSLLRLQH